MVSVTWTHFWTGTNWSTQSIHVQIECQSYDAHFKWNIICHISYVKYHMPSHIICDISYAVTYANMWGNKPCWTKTYAIYRESQLGDVTEAKKNINPKQRNIYKWCNAALRIFPDNALGDGLAFWILSTKFQHQNQYRSGLCVSHFKLG